MPVTRILTAYAASELTGRARDNARDWYRIYRMPDDWDEPMKDDLKAVAATLGFSLDEILCSGFAVQGDGASFIGRYAWRADWQQAANAEFGGDLKEGILRFGRDLEALQQTLGYTMSATIEHSGSSEVHSGTMRFTLDEHTQNVVDDATLQEAEKEFKDILYFFSYWMWKRLWHEYDALREDEVVDEALDEMGHIFDVNGEPLRC